MGEVFLKLLNMSLTAGWLILAVLCFRFIFRKTPKWVICLLWGVVAIRLICPFSIESTFGLLSGTEPIKEFAVVEGEIQDYVPSINSDLQIVKNSVNPMLAETFAYEEYDSVAPLQVAAYIGGIVWGCGMIFMFLYAVMSLLRLHLRIRESVPYKDNIMICDAVKSPFILGNIRPRIYLSSGLHENEIKYIVAHEYAHLKRGDHWWKSIGYLLLCVYWFSPLCWIAYILFCKDIELACDEKVIRDMDIEDKKEYSRTLLSCARQREMVLACPLAFGEVGVKERVKSVLNYKKPAFWMILVSIAACLGIAVCFLTTFPRKYQIRITIPVQNIEAIQFDGMIGDASKIDVKEFVKSLSEVTPLAAEDTSRLGEQEYIVTLHGEDRSKESFYFYQDAAEKDKWYVTTEEGKIFQNAEFITEYIRVSSGDDLKVTVGIPDLDVFGQVMDIHKKLKELEVTYSTADMRALLVMEIQSQKALWDTEEAAVQGAKDYLTKKMAQYEYAVRQGYTLSDEELEARILKEDTMIKETSGFSELEQCYEQYGMTWDEYQQDRKEYRKIQFTIANLYEEVYDEFRRGNIRIGDQQAKNMNEYWNYYLMEVVFPETEAYTNETLKPLLDEAENFYWTYFK